MRYPVQEFPNYLNGLCCPWYLDLYSAEWGVAGRGVQPADAGDTAAKDKA